MSRTPKLTPAIQAAIVKAVAHGIPVSRAALLAGVSDSAVSNWLAWGDQGGQQIYVEFLDAVKKARAEDEQRRLRRIEAAAKGGAILSERTVTWPNGQEVREVKRAAPAWQADCWFLERRLPADYALRAKIDQRHTVSESMKALLQQWQQLKAAPVPEPRALPAPQDYTDAEVVPLPQRRPAEQPSQDAVFDMLDRLNGTGEYETDER